MLLEEVSSRETLGFGPEIAADNPYTLQVTPEKEDEDGARETARSALDSGNPNAQSICCKYPCDSYRAEVMRQRHDCGGAVELLGGAVQKPTISRNKVKDAYLKSDIFILFGADKRKHGWATFGTDWLLSFMGVNSSPTWWIAKTGNSMKPSKALELTQLCS
ncbi:hypothetical protein AAES_125318 [Amazona aestiva]|uniref:Uncharacterized protein n=1 Tax=Amazona aestiva TaxID=12930 RepID=A0A0Q3M4Z1_AMAAE|nr:hypothetical protein AAES_125318 [Amazona aestiva]